MNDLVESIIGFDALYNSMYKCKNNVLWKASVSHYFLNGIEQTIKLENHLKNGTYIPKPPLKFMITSPKKREAVSIAFRDRVYQRSLNDNVIYPIMTHSFIYDNCACQKGKGTDFARDRLHSFMRKFYRKHKLNGYVLQMDIKGYYPNMQHSLIEQRFKEKLPKEAFEMARKVLVDQYVGDVGYNPGSQMIQIAGVTALDKLDHYIKEKLHIKYYLRYMDDSLIIHEDKEYLEYCKNEIEKELNKIGFNLHQDKTRILSIKESISFLGFNHRLTETGKLVMTVKHETIKREKRKLVRMAHLVQKGYMSKEKVDVCFESWKAHAGKGNSFKLLQHMNKFYKELWEESKNASSKKKQIN